MANELSGRRIALLIAPQGTEQPEFAEPRSAVEQAGAEVEVVGAEVGKAQAVNHDLQEGDTFTVDAAFSDVRAEDYDALVVPGGTVGSDTLRGNPEAVRFIRAFFDQGKPAAVICHGPWTLVEAGVVRGRTLTSFPSLRTDIENAGGTWVDREVVVDGKLVTSRKPDDLPAFCDALVETFAAA